MKVSELIAVLEALPPEKEVLTMDDAGRAFRVDEVFLAKGGHVALYESGWPLYDDEYRPVGSPSVSEQKYFEIGSVNRGDD